ncbi:MAG: diguanylate cyclase [Gemmatimonadota bacterium]
MAYPEALDIALALQPLYGTEADPDAIGDQAATRLGELLGTSLRLELPGAPPAGPPGADGEPAWSLDFGHADARGRILGPGACPPEAVQAALRVELERLAAYLALLRSLGSAHDRLEFRLRALHQIARTLTIGRGPRETETLVADFTRELFFAWWVALYRPRGDGTMDARVVHSLRGQSAPPRLRSELLVRTLPVGTESRAVPVTERLDWLPTEARALAALDTGGVRIGCLMLGDRMNGEPYADDDLQLLATLAHTSAITLWNAELVERLREQAIQDDLTGLYNRRFFDAKLFDEVGRAHRYGRPLSLLLLDLDAFKAYNDEYGHTAGDVLLARIGLLLTAAAAAALAWGWIRLTSPPSPRERLEEMRTSLVTLRSAADSCRTALDAEERAFQAYTRNLDSLRARIGGYESLDPRGVPADSYVAYLEHFNRYNTGVERREAASESLQAHWNACRAVAETHSAVADSARTLARDLGLWTDTTPDSSALAP